MKKREVVIYKKSTENDLSFDKLFWVFFAGSFLGVIVEGLYSVWVNGYWESHVVTVWGWFNLLYGIGALGFYYGAAKLKDRSLAVKVSIMTAIATIIELLCGILLKYVLGMRAWNYSTRFMNIDGFICPAFILVWGGMALMFCLSFRRISHILDKIEHPRVHIAAVVLSILLGLNYCFASAAIVRWSKRHYGLGSETRLGSYLDRSMNDEWMSSRFMDWYFVDELEKSASQE